MSIIGSRLALWNQDDLVQERDKYGANDVQPGLTGWAQINGRDELEISVEWRFDGEYVEKMGMWMDLKCFLGTIGSVLSSDDGVEGSTDEMHKEGKDTDTVVSPEKLKKEIQTGAVVAGVGCAVALATVLGICRFLHQKSNLKETAIGEYRNRGQ